MTTEVADSSQPVDRSTLVVDWSLVESREADEDQDDDDDDNEDVKEAARKQPDDQHLSAALSSPVDDNDDDDERKSAAEVTQVRLLVRRREAGALIGKRGANIKRLRETFKSCVLSIPDTGNGPERVVCVNAADEWSLNSILGDLTAMLMHKSAFGCHLTAGEQVEVKLLIHSSHAGSIIGVGGQTIRKLRSESKAAIKIYEMCCPLSNERVCAIKAKPPVVVETIKLINALVKDNAIKGAIKPYDALNFDLQFVHKYGGYLPDELALEHNQQQVAPASQLLHLNHHHHHHLLASGGFSPAIRPASSQGVYATSKNYTCWRSTQPPEMCKPIDSAAAQRLQPNCCGQELTPAICQRLIKDSSSSVVEDQRRQTGWQSNRSMRFNPYSLALPVQLAQHNLMAPHLQPPLSFPLRQQYREQLAASMFPRPHLAQPQPQMTRQLALSSSSADGLVGLCPPDRLSCGCSSRGGISSTTNSSSSQQQHEHSNSGARQSACLCMFLPVVLTDPTTSTQSRDSNTTD